MFFSISPPPIAAVILFNIALMVPEVPELSNSWTAFPGIERAKPFDIKGRDNRKVLAVSKCFAMVRVFGEADGRCCESLLMLQ